jgi:hypothetical protein
MPQLYFNINEKVMENSTTAAVLRWREFFNKQGGMTKHNMHLAFGKGWDSQLMANLEQSRKEYENM